MSIKPKSALQLYRDCLRLVKHVAGDSPKADHLRAIVGSEFRKNKDETDERRIHDMKQSAERALSNYFLFEHVQTDQKFEKFRSQTEEEVAAAHDVLTKQAASAAGVDDEVDTLDMTEVSAHEAEMGTDAPVYGDGSDRGSQEGESEEGSDFAAPWDADDDDEVAVSPGDSEVDSLFDDGDDGDHEEYGLLVDESDSDSDFSDSEADVESDGAGVR